VKETNENLFEEVRGEGEGFHGNGEVCLFPREEVGDEEIVNTAEK